MGPLSLSNFQINNMATPTLSNDATNKGYVDNKFTTLIGNEVNSTTTASHSITLTFPLTTRTIVVINSFVLNFTTFMTSTNFISIFGAQTGYSIIIAPGSSASTTAGIPTTQFVFTSVTLGATTITYNVGFAGTTGYSTYFYQ